MSEPLGVLYLRNLRNPVRELSEASRDQIIKHIDNLETALTLTTQRADTVGAQRDAWVNKFEDLSSMTGAERRLDRDRIYKLEAERDAALRMRAEQNTTAAQWQAEAAKLRAECDALRKDAARLDWLEARTEIGPADPDFPDLTRRWLQVTGYETSLREIIDAALAVQP